MPHPARPPLDRSTILITGASAGIGREMARQLAPRAARLMLVARRDERLRQLEAEFARTAPRCIVDVLVCDLADRAAVTAMLDEVERQGVQVDVLINNAGIGQVAPYDRAPWERVERIIEVNAAAPALLTHRLVGPMVARRRGGVLNVSSGLGLLIAPGSAAYCASKHFLSALSDTLRLDLAGTGVAVSQSCPGPVQTEFGEANGVPARRPRGWDPLTISAEQCARESLGGFERGDASIFPGFTYRQAMRVATLLPAGLQRRLMERYARRTRRDLLRPAGALPARVQRTAGG
jgi:uncharacterized protein